MQEAREKEQAIKKEKDNIKRLKKQIKAEKFAQTTGGKIFNKIADIGDAGWRSTKKFLSEPPKQAGKKPAKRVDVNDLIKRLPQ